MRLAERSAQSSYSIMVGTTDRLTGAIPGSNDNRGHDPLDRLILLAGSDYPPNRGTGPALEASPCLFRFVGLVNPRPRSLFVRNPRNRTRDCAPPTPISALAQSIL